jgi:hypothetical protein
MSQLPLYTADQAEVLAQVIHTLRTLAHCTHRLDEEEGLPYAAGLMARLLSETLERAYNTWMDERDRCTCGQQHAEEDTRGR